MTIKKLVIFDLDNTLTDTFAMWHKVTVAALDMISDRFALDRAVLTKAYLGAPEQYRFADFEKMVDWLDANGHLPEAATPEQQYSKNIVKAFIAGQVDKVRRETSHFYDDALAAMRALKAEGVSVAIYTDAEAAPLIKRLWLMAGNADGTPQDILNLVDHFYCRPSVECDAQVLRSINASFVLSMKEKMTLWADGLIKPVPGHTQIILNDFGVSAEEAVFVGDSYKDGGCAVPIGVDFAWYRQGAVATPEAIAVVQSICDPGWSYGVDVIMSKFNASSLPCATIDNMRCLFSHFKFGMGNACAPATEHASLHRVGAQFGQGQRNSGIGPKTHL